MIEQKDFQQIGFLGKIHGVRGEITADLNVDLSELIEEEDKLFLMLEINKLLVPFRLESYRPKGAELSLLKFHKIDTKEKAGKLQGLRVWLSKEYLEDVSEDLITDWRFFINYNFFDDNGTPIGQIIDIEDSTANILFVVRNNCNKEILIPIIPENVTKVDQDNGCIYMIIPEGLLDL